MFNGRAAAVPRGAKSKLKPQPGREFVCLVGGASNTFNGWYFIAQKAGAAGDSDYFGCPPPSTLNEVQSYIDPPAARPATKAKTLAEAMERKRNPKPYLINLSKIPVDKRRDYGLSDENIDKFKARTWETADVWAWPPTTHDIYWGNFVDPATRLFKQGPAWRAPLERPVPRPGDIVTFMVFWPAYEKRMKVDWDASPYNMAHWKKYDAMKIWHTEWMHQSGGPSAPTANTPPSHRDVEQQREKLKAREAYGNKLLSEQDINFYLMMRLAGENENGYQKKPADHDSYLRYTYNRLISGVEHKGVMVKILLCNSTQQIVDYIGKGTWSGDLWDTYSPYVDWDHPSRKELEERGKRKNPNYAVEPPREYHKVRGRLRYASWAGAPAVNRKTVKIARFDYVGHSSAGSMMLDYGWFNKKGEPPNVNPADEMSVLRSADFDRCLTNALTRDAKAMLWGCNLGDPPKADRTLSIGPYVAEKYFGGGVVAADAATLFTEITGHETNMPFPVNNKPWVLFPHGKKASN